MALLVANLSWVEGGDAVKTVAAALGVTQKRVKSAILVKKSLDSRHRQPTWRAVFKAEVDDEEGILRKNIPSVRRWSERDAGRYGLESPLKPTPRIRPESARPIVVGLGPAGMFAALYLAEAGMPPLVIERGGPVEPRVNVVNGHWRGKLPLDTEDNLVFGEGGAGTFSDGKIYTRRRDGELGYVFRKLVEFGADEEILQESWAHLGTDKIRALLPPFRARLAELGAELRFHTRVDDLVVEGGRCVGVRLSDGTEIRSDAVLVATGHSARDTMEALVRAGAAAKVRGIAVGARIEHPQTVIDKGRYGREDRGDLPPASYRLAHNPTSGPRGHTFCMCPGGMVVPAMNHTERVVVNGMSFAARRAFWANSAVIVDVPPEAYGASDPLAGFRWQDTIEKKAFELGGGTYAAPAQRVVDFLAGRPSDDLPKTSYPLGVVPVDLFELFPGFLARGMVDAIKAFDRQLPGFAHPEAVLIAPETRTTSPVQFARTETMESITLPGLYPVGEGAGFAGGIVSSALDGLRAARAIAG